ncbi:MAG: (d)CMP kinase [Chloroflexota bacterium]
MTAPRTTVVAVDGPSGVGKSTVGRRIAAHLGLPYLDTGAMYRAVGLKVKRAGIALPVDGDGGPRAAAVAAIAEGADVRVTEESRTLLDGEDVSAEIRSPEISLYASAVSAVPAVRRRLAAIQRRLALEGGGVLEGRDIGTKVVPETPHKLFLDAPAEVRARRRHAEFAARGSAEAFEKVLAEMVARDLADETRADSPLTCNATYRRIDTSGLDVDGVVAACLAAIATPAVAGGATTEPQEERDRPTQG